MERETLNIIHAYKRHSCFFKKKSRTLSCFERSLEREPKQSAEVGKQGADQTKNLLQVSTLCLTMIWVSNSDWLSHNNEPIDAGPQAVEGCWRGCRICWNAQEIRYVRVKVHKVNEIYLYFKWLGSYSPHRCILLFEFKMGVNFENPRKWCGIWWGDGQTWPHG
jgi:hypothetical protein